MAVKKYDQKTTIKTKHYTANEKPCSTDYIKNWVGTGISVPSNSKLDKRRMVFR